MSNARSLATERELAAIKASPWWRMTAPGRKVVEQFKNRSASKQHKTIAKQRSAAAGAAKRKIESRDKRAALGGRLHTVLVNYELIPSPVDDLESLVGQVGALLADRPLDELLWLLHIAFLGDVPTGTDMERLTGDLHYGGPQAVIDDLRDRWEQQSANWAVLAPMRLVTDVVVDVTFTAKTRVGSGIQRVVREVVPRWVSTHEPCLLVFDDECRVWRQLTGIEEGHVLKWRQWPRDETAADAVVDYTIMVPWRTTLVLPEIATESYRVDRLRSLARWSGSTVSAIYYDLIPIAHPEFVPAQVTRESVMFLSTLQSATRVSAISAHAANELSVVLSALLSQDGGPTVVAHPLPTEAHEPTPEAFETARQKLVGDAGHPMILCVSSVEPRKNLLRLLRAAETLWREGFDFQLVLFGGSRWDTDEFDRELDVLLSAGRPIISVFRATEADLWSAYRLARFSVFVSLAEGFGLPAAESLAAGTPVVLSDSGAVAEVGRAGGVESVDPLSVTSISEGMRRLLVDDARLAELQEQIAKRPKATWDGYAAQVWDWLAARP